MDASPFTIAGRFDNFSFGDAQIFSIRHFVLRPARGAKLKLEYVQGFNFKKIE